MRRPTQPHYLTHEDIRLCDSPGGCAKLLSRLGYGVDHDPTPLPPADLGFAPLDQAALEVVYLLAEQSDPRSGTTPLQVILLKLRGDTLNRVRSLATNFLARGGNYLLIATTDYGRLAFVNPRREAGRVKVRKLVVDRMQPTRHDLDILDTLAVNAQDPEALYRTHCGAFDVEAVTQRFYREYASLFRHAQTVIRDHNKGVAQFYDVAKLHAFTQRLLGRLMFLYFIQKKGWLAGDPHFLTHQYRAVTRDEGNYYLLVLEPLFFDTLNKRRPNDTSRFGSIPYLNGGLFEKDYARLLDLPNSLFDPGSDMGILGFFNNYNFTIAEDTPVEQDVAVDPEMLGKVFENMMAEDERGQSGTFYTPRPIVHYMCREALLGYLTDATDIPRDRLAAQLDEEDEGVLAEHRLTPGQASQIERALDSVRVLDPAVGTGAFLLGILHALVQIKRACFRARGATVSRSGALIAEWKRQFIAHALHGVDIKAEAIEIAKLRLWLSLVVDLERDQVEPLPNLDYKLMVGNSLLETLDGKPILQLEGQGPTQMGLGLSPTEQAMTRLVQLKERFFQAEPEKRADLRQAIQTQEARIVLSHLDERLESLTVERDKLARQGAVVNWRGMRREQDRLNRLVESMGRLVEVKTGIQRGDPLPFFLYRLHFFDVFRDQGGFDIVIANPPYVRQELIRAQKPELQVTYPQVYHGVADLYVYFYARGLDLLRPGGMLAYISSNKYMRAGYGEKLRTLLSQTTALEQVIDFGDLPVFDATAYPSIVILRKAAPAADQSPRVLTVSDRDTLDRFEEEAPRLAWSLPQRELQDAEWTIERPEVLQLKKKLRLRATSFKSIAHDEFFMGIKTGLNEAFVIDAATRERLIAADPRSAEIIKPWLRGRDIERWHLDWEELYLLAIQNSGDADTTHPWKDIRIETQALKIFRATYPAIYEQVAQFEQQLKSRTDQGRYWWELRSCDYYAAFEQPKILWSDIAPHVGFTYDQDGYYGGNTMYFTPVNSLFVLGILNSSTTEFYYRLVSSAIRGGFLRFFIQFVSQLPIPDASSGDRAAIETLVQRLLEIRGEGPAVADLEGELNERVYRLFGLTRDEIRLIEGRT